MWLAWIWSVTASLAKKRWCRVGVVMAVVVLLLTQTHYEPSMRIFFSTRVTATLERAPPPKSASATNTINDKPMCSQQRFHDSPSVLPGISLVTAVMNRNDQLTKSLTNWLQVKGVEEVVVVDWSSEPGVISSVLEPYPQLRDDPRITVITVPRQTRWVLTRACNLAAFHSRGQYIMKLDSDVLLSVDFFDHHPLLERSFYAGNWKQARVENERHLNGIFFTRREDFMRVNGYDERIVSYGWDDDDLYRRLEALSLQRLSFNLDMLKHDEHTDAIRVVHQHSLGDVGKLPSYVASSFPDVQILRNKRMISIASPWTIGTRTMECRMSPMSGMEEALSSGRHCLCEPTNFVPRLSSLISADTYKLITVEVMRTVLKYTSRLPHEVIEKMATPLRLAQQLDLHYWNRPKYLVVHLQNALSNRMLAFASAKVARLSRWC